MAPGLERRSRGWADPLALLVLWLTAAVIAAPILCGGWNTYLDNPVHVAEIIDMARPDFRGWSDLALCGFPLGALHSPLWYGLLVALFRAGVPLGILYATALLVAFSAPATVVYVLARRHLTPASACAVAYLLLAQVPASAGIAAALGGMWTFYLASAILLVLLDALARPERTACQALRIAVLTGLAGLSHSFFLPVLVLVALVHGAAVAIRRDRARMGALLAWDAPAMVLGLLAASAYWLPLVLMRDWLVPVSSNVSVLQLAKHLVLPLDILAIRAGAWPSPAELVHGLPMVLLLGLGLAGGVAMARDRTKRSGVMRYGVMLGGLTLVLLLVVSRTRIGWLGPLSWRLLYLTRLGLALAAVTALAGRVRLPPRVALLAAVLAVSLGALWGQPLARAVPLPGDQGVVDAHRVWAWLRANREAGWGRVLVQDTFHSDAPDTGLEWSHLLARTASESSIEQLGPYYSALPFPTDAWALTEFAHFLGVRLDEPAALPMLKLRMAGANVTHVVLARPWARSQVQDDPDFHPLATIGDYTIYRFREGRSRPAFSGDAITAEVERPSPGRLHVRADSAAGGALWISESYHPFWRIQGNAGVTVQTTEIGLMALTLPSGRHDLWLDYVEPRLPTLLTTAVWCLFAIGALACAAVSRTSRRRTGDSTLGERAC